MEKKCEVEHGYAGSLGGVGRLGVKDRAFALRVCSLICRESSSAACMCLLGEGGGEGMVAKYEYGSLCMFEGSKFWFRTGYEERRIRLRWDVIKRQVRISRARQSSGRIVYRGAQTVLL